MHACMPVLPADVFVKLNGIFLYNYCTIKRLVAHVQRAAVTPCFLYRTFYREVKAAGLDYLPVRKRGH